MNVISKLANKPVCFALFSNRYTRQHNTLSLSFLAVFFDRFLILNQLQVINVFVMCPTRLCFSINYLLFCGKLLSMFRVRNYKIYFIRCFIDIILLLSTEFLSSIQNWWTWILREVHYSQPKSSVSRIEQNLKAR